MKHSAPAQPRCTRAATTPNAARPKQMAAAIRKTSCTGVMPCTYPGDEINMGTLAFLVTLLVGAWLLYKALMSRWRNR